MRGKARRTVGFGVTTALLLGLALHAACGGSDRKRKPFAEYGPPRPYVTSVSNPVVNNEPKGYVGDHVNIVGKHFHPIPSQNIVSFDGGLTTALGGDTELLVVAVPSSAGTGPLNVEVDGRLSNSLPFTVLGGPQIFVLTPPLGPSGTLVTITGINFSSVPEDNTILFDFDGATGIQTAALTASRTQLTCYAPEDADTGNVIVRVGGLDSNTAPYAYTTPQLVNVTPRSGVVGNTVTLCGLNFDLQPDQNIIRFNGTFTSTLSVAPSACTVGGMELTCTVPSGAVAGPVTVETYGRESNGIFFCVWTPSSTNPNISNMNPSSGSWGDTVRINGSGFASVATDNEVRFNGILAPVIGGGAGFLDVLVPPGAITGPITVTVGSRSDQSGGDFTISNPAPPAPMLDVLKPSAGYELSSIVLEGANFNSVPKNNFVTFAGVPAEVLGASDEALMVKVPYTESGVVTVEVGGQISNGLYFAIEGAPPGVGTFPFFGRQLQSPSNSVVYVVDLSGSMSWGFGQFTNRFGQNVNGSCLQMVQDRLIFSISELPPHFRFNIITYSQGQITCPNNVPWQPSLVQATEQNKNLAVSWILTWVANGGTATTYAVEAALQMDLSNRTVCLITDGQWTCPTNETDEDQLCRIFNANLQQAQIHTVSVLVGGRFAELLRSIALVTNGSFTKADPPLSWP